MYKRQAPRPESRFCFAVFLLHIRQYLESGKQAVYKLGRKMKLLLHRPHKRHHIRRHNKQQAKARERKYAASKLQPVFKRCVRKQRVSRANTDICPRMEFRPRHRCV